MSAEMIMDNNEKKRIIIMEKDNPWEKNQGPVVQSIVSLTSSLRGQPVRCFATLYPNTLNCLLKK